MRSEGSRQNVLLRLLSPLAARGYLWAKRPRAGDFPRTVFVETTSRRNLDGGAGEPVVLCYALPVAVGDAGGVLGRSCRPLLL